MDLNEAVVEHEFSVDLADAGLKSEDGLVGWHTQINDTVVETNILTHNGHLVFLTLLFFLVATSTALSLLIQHQARRVFDLERKNWDGLVYAPNLLHAKLNLLRARRDWLIRHHHGSHHLDNGLFGKFASESDHPLADLALLNEEDSLNGGVLLAPNNECRLALAASVVDTTSDANILTLERGI